MEDARRPPLDLRAGAGQLVDPDHDDVVADPAVSIYVELYRPLIADRYWTPIAEFVRGTVTRSRPENTRKARELMMASTHFVHWATRAEGMPLSTSMFSKRIVEEYVASRKDWSDRTKNVARGHLRDLVNRLNSGIHSRSELQRSFRSLATAPYTASEVLLLHAWASGRGSERRRHHAWTALALGLGCGLTGIEIVSCRFDQVTDYGPDVGIVVQVPGLAGTRDVWCTVGWEATLRRLLHAPMSNPYLFCGNYADRSTGQAWDALSTRISDAGRAPSSHRLRATWFVSQLNARTPVKVLMEAGGISAVSTLTPYLAHVDAVAARPRREALRLGAAPRAEFHDIDATISVSSSIES